MENYKNKLTDITKDLRPIDDVMFQKLGEDRGFCLELLRKVLQDDKIELIENIVQCSIKNIAGSSVILDLKCVFRDKRLCNVEVQKSDDEDHVRRANYNASMLETSYSTRGSKFEDLPKTIVIFITEKDFFGYGKAVYHQKEVISVDGEQFEIETGRQIIYLNIQSEENSDIAQYIKQFGESDPDKCTSPNLKRVLSSYKKDEKGESLMNKELNKLMEEIKEESITEGKSIGIAEGRSIGMAEGRAEGITEGRAEERISSIKNMVKAGLSKEIILQCNYTEEEYEEVLKNL